MHKSFKNQDHYDLNSHRGLLNLQFLQKYLSMNQMYKAVTQPNKKAEDIQ